MRHLSPENLARWRADIVTWAQECVWVRSPETGTKGPLVLADHQRDFLREATQRDEAGHFTNRTCVISTPKREGKTLCAALLGAWRASCFEDQRGYVLANSERQAQSNIFDAIAGFFRDSPDLRGLIPQDGFGRRRLSFPLSRSFVEALPCNEATTQGLAVDFLLSDELHAAENPRAFEFLSNQTEAADAQVIVASQAGAPVDSNPIWRLHQAREEAGILFLYLTEHRLPWAVALAERAKKTLLPGEWSYQHENAWGACGLKLLPASLVEAVCLSYLQPQRREDWRLLVDNWGLRDCPCVIGVGLDRAGVGRSGDRTVWTVTARFQRQDGDTLFAVVRQDVLPTGSEAEVLQADRETREIFGEPRGMIFEYYGCSDLVEKVSGARLEAPSAQRQQGLFNRLYRLFEEERICFPEECGLLKEELVRFEYDAEREGLTRFGTQRGHDDTVYSLAWSLEAADGGPETESGAFFL